MLVAVGRRSGTCIKRLSLTLEGTPLITSIARSSLTGWTVAAGTAETSLVAPLWRSLAKRVRTFGPKVPLSPRLAVTLSMILHEIATNAAKYGALSNDTGTVTLDWEIIEESDGRKLRLLWTEAGGPHVTAPPRSGREGRQRNTRLYLMSFR